MQSVESVGLIVTVTDHIRGLCPSMHLADVRLKRPERKFKEKKKMKFRVSICLCVSGCFFVCL